MRIKRILIKWFDAHGRAHMRREKRVLELLALMDQ